MNATIKSKGSEAIIRLANGCTVHVTRKGVETWAPGNLLLYRGPSVDLPTALSYGITHQTR